MDKTKAHDKHGDVDSRGGQTGNMSRWQREMFKNFVGGGGFDNDFPTHPYFSPMPWSHPPHLWSHPLFQHLAHSAMPESPGQIHEQDKEHEGPQGGTQPAASDKSQTSPNCDMSGPSAGVGRRPFQSTSKDSNYDELHNMGGMRPPYNYPSGFMFPMPPYQGMDPLMLYMHHMRRQAAYLYSMPGCRNGYQSPLPVPPAGTNQRGFIKIPSGIPQKQTHLWETQSSENMQLWATVTQLCATVARAEAEIFCQRGKISKLEDDLEAMRIRQDALSEAVKGSTVSPQTRRERRKRTATVPVAILGLPASQPFPIRAQAKKARGSMNEGNSLKPSGELVSEGNCEQACHNTTLELTNGSIQNGNEPPTVGLNRSQSRVDSMEKGTLDRQHSNIDSSCVNVIDSSLNQSSIRGIVPEETTRGTSGLEKVEIKQECITDSLTDEADRSKHDRSLEECITDSLTNEADRSKDGGNLDTEQVETCIIPSSTKHTVYSGDCCQGSETMETDDVCSTENKAQQRADADSANKKSESFGNGKEDNRLEGVEIVSTGDLSHGALPSSTNSLARPNAISSGNAVVDWHRLLPNGQVGTSAPCDKEAEAINACTLDGFDGTDAWTKEVMEVLK